MEGSCSCGLLPKWARDSDTRITYEEGEGRYILTLADTLRIALACCPSCGGYSEPRMAPRECACGVLAKWATDPTIPIGFKNEFNEYYLITFTGSNILFSYCPSCGGWLLPSRRGDFFTVPSTTEMVELRDKLESATSIDEVLRLLGEPDERHGPIANDPRQKEIYGMRDIKQGLRYTSLSKTLILTVQELEDGEIQMLIEGKPKEPDRLAGC